MTPAAEPLTPRMQQALAWLATVGKATTTTLKRHGYSTRTLNALAERDLIDCEYHPNRTGGFLVYRPKHPDQ